MGVKLKSLITNTTLPLSDLSGKTVAIDGMNMLFQILYNPYQMQKKLPDTFYLDRTLRVISHLYGWLQKVIGFYKAKILPVVVFDGLPDPSKQKATQSMVRNFLAIKKDYEKALEAGDRKEAKQLALSTSFMFLNCVRESKILLKACGIPVIMAPGEAEAQCVELLKKNIVDYVISTDYDVLLYDAPEFIKQITFSTRAQVDGKWKSVTPDLTLINLETNLSALSINRLQLIDLSILLGNDYYPGVKGIGPKKALTSVKHYRTLENMVKIHPELFKNAHLPLARIKRIRSQFLSPKVSKSNYNFSVSPLQISTLRELLVEDHTLNLAKLDRFLIRLKRAHKSFTKRRKVSKPTHTAIVEFASVPQTTSQSLRPPNEEISPIRTKAERVIRDLSKPHQFHDQFQRRLDRGKKQSQPSTISYEFTSATQLKPPAQTQTKKLTIKKKSK